MRETGSNMRFGGTEFRYKGDKKVAGAVDSKINSTNVFSLSICSCQFPVRFADDHPHRYYDDD